MYVSFWVKLRMIAQRFVSLCRNALNLSKKVFKMSNCHNMLRSIIDGFNQMQGRL